MKARIPVIKTASDTGQTRFRLWDMLSEANRAQLVKLMRKRGNSEWNPGEVIVIEPSEEIVRIMESNSDVKGGR